MAKRWALTRAPHGSKTPIEMTRLPLLVAAFIIAAPVLGATGGPSPASSGGAASGSSAHAGGGGAGAHGGGGSPSAHGAAASTHGAAAHAHAAVSKHVETLNSSSPAARMDHHRHPYRYPALREPRFAAPYMGACMPDPNSRIPDFWAPCATPDKTRPKTHG